MLEFITGQIIALLTFFAFPAFQYISLKRFAQKEGQLELWYLPDHCFRLVIRNMRNKRVLSDIKFRVSIRKIVSSSSESSVKSYRDTVLLEQEEFFLFPRNDQTLVSFQLVRSSSDELDFVFTDKFGEEKERFAINEFDCLICDYVATVENVLNFDIKLARRVELKTPSLHSFWKAVQQDNTEQSFPIDRIRIVE